MNKSEALAEARMLVGHYGPMLGLDNWLIYVEYDKDMEPGTFAEVLPTEGRLCATMTVGPDWKASSEQQRRMTILHELLHCCHHRLTEQTRVVAAAAIESQTLYDTLWAGVRNEAEFMVDQLSVALVDILPEP